MCACKMSLICTSRATGECHEGYSKKPFSKAAVSEEARRTLRYVEPLSDARTKLADFFSILLIACPDKQVVRSQPILSDTGLRIEHEMSGGVCDWLELVCQRQGLRIGE
ncbi:MAG: hypothetical protein EWM73_01624 [Nitrospira sp.]|nr:MAG: hypothetical protein EWM73_01624 [Nitrospira sp.]